MTPTVTLTFRDLTGSAEDRDRLRRFHDELYAPEFPDPDEKESLANIEAYLALKQTGWYGSNNYHVVLAEADGHVVGGVIADYLADPNAGVIEFLVVAPGCRDSGVGRGVLDHIEAMVAADARRAHGRWPDWIIAEINDPFRIDLDADNLDPFVRARIWGRWGYGKVDFPYVQPALSPAQEPVHHLMLAGKPVAAVERDSIAAATVVQMLRAYLRWAMRIPEPDANEEYRAMVRHLDAVAGVPVIGLGRYVGDDPSGPVLIAEVGGADPDLDAVIRVYRDAFPPGATSVDPDVFGRATARTRDRGVRHHLWAIRADATGPVAGMASFFSLPRVGFGGYLALDAPLRGRGCTRAVIARIEEQMRRDRMGARGWLIECEPGSPALAVFSRLGFRELALEYRQPALGSARDRTAPPLALAYKAFGTAHGVPALTRAELRAALVEVFRAVYEVAVPEQHPLFRDLDTQMTAWPTSAVEWRPAR